MSATNAWPTSVDTEFSPWTTRSGRGWTSLNRADWRFLLPGPPRDRFEHLVLVGGPRELEDVFRGLGHARRVSRRPSSDGSVDALVLLADADVPLAAALSGLRIGAAVYLEVDRRRPSQFRLSPSRVRRLLQDRDVAPSETYWVYRGLSTPRVYLPVGAPNALRWYMSTVFSDRTPTRRLLSATSGVLSRAAGAWTDAILPWFAVTGTVGTSNWSLPSPLGALPPSLNHLTAGTRSILLAGGQGAWSRATLLPFRRGQSLPAAVIKVARVPAANEFITHEHVTLAHLRASLDAGSRDGIPEPLGLAHWGQLAVAVERFAAGRKLSASSARWRTPWRDHVAELDRVIRWLENFNSRLAVRRVVWDDEMIERWLEVPLARYAETFGATPSERGLFDRARGRARLLRGTMLPLVWQHKDLGAWNIVRDRDRMTVIDWEVSRVGPALCDLVYFVTHWSLALPRERGVSDSTRRPLELLFQHGRHGQLAPRVRDSIAKFMAHLEIDVRFLPLLLLYTYVEQALDRVGRLRATGALSADPREDNMYVKLVAALAAEAGHVFGTGGPWARPSA